MTYRRTGMALLAVSAMVLAGITAVRMVSASAEESTDAELIRNAVRNFQARGVHVNASDLFVLRARTAYGEEWRVGPKGTRFDVERVGTDAAGKAIHTIATVDVLEPPAADPALPQPGAAAQPRWVQQRTTCTDEGIWNPDTQSYLAIRTVCATYSRQEDDTDPNYVFYQYRVEASGRSVDPLGRELKRMWVEAQSHRQYPGFPNYGELDGANTWHGGSTFDQRHVGLNIPIKTPGGIMMKRKTGQEID